MSTLLKYTHIHHVSVLTQNVEQARKFYQVALGLEEIRERPKLSTNGFWLEIGQQQIHIIECLEQETSGVKAAPGGQDRHIALGVNNLADIKERLESHHIEYKLSQSGRQALFCRDPDGNAIEMIENSR